MIKLKNLKSDFQFKRLLSQKKIHTDYFSVYFGKNLTKENNNKLNISFIMKKKVGSSVVRNKIKRRLRAAIQKNLAEADGSRDNLPAPANAPKKFGLGIKREAPKHY